MMAINSVDLSSKLEGVLDTVVENGIPIEIEHKGLMVRIVPMKKHRSIDSLVAREGYLRVDPDEVVHIDWSEFWKT